MPANTHLFSKEVIKGDWLKGDEGEAVINHTFLSKYPDSKVGKEITVKANGKLKKVVIKGVIRELFAAPTLYINREEIKEWPEMTGKLNCVMLAYNHKDNDPVVNSARLEQWFKREGYPVALVFRKDEYKQRVIEHLVIITTMLIMVSILLKIVGGLGLITSMGINIMEQIRELAVLRSIGVTNRRLYRIILYEGIVTGVISWIFSVMLAIPVSLYLGNKFFTIFFETTLNFSVSITGIMVWLVIILIFSAVAVIVPARNSVRQPVIEGLNYE